MRVSEAMNCDVEVAKPGSAEGVKDVKLVITIIQTPRSPRAYVIASRSAGADNVKIARIAASP
jgi:hypothetical protein